MPKMNITTKPLRRFSEIAARISLIAATIFLVLFALLHIIKPEIEPSWRFFSEYELGRYGWLMVIAFLSLMLSSTGLLIAIGSQIRTVGGYLGMALLLVSAAGFGLAAFFITDSITVTIATTHGRIHSIGALLGGNIAGAAYLLGWSLGRNKAWAAERRALLWITGLAFIGNVSSIIMSVMIAQAHNQFGPNLPVGWPNRILIVAYAAWMMALAWRVLRLRRSAA